MLCPATCVLIHWAGGSSETVGGTRAGPFVSELVSAATWFRSTSPSPTAPTLLAHGPPRGCPPGLGPSCCLPLGGGISSYADNPSGAGQSLVECLNQALRDVPKERHAGTPLYLGATAGIRLLK